MNTTRLPRFACPHCGYKVDSASALEGDYKPSPGDFSLCMKCGEWVVFTDDLGLRKPDDSEYFVIGTDPDCRAARRAWVRMVEHIGTPPTRTSW